MRKRFVNNTYVYAYKFTSAPRVVMEGGDAELWNVTKTIAGVQDVSLTLNPLIWSSVTLINVQHGGQVAGLRCV